MKANTKIGSKSGNFNMTHCPVQKFCDLVNLCPRTV